MKRAKLLVAALGILVIGGASILGQEKKARRIDSVNWNPATHKLTWSVSDGTMEADGGKFKADKKTSFEIDMDSATMTLNGEVRRFSKEEAAHVHAVMNFISRYAAESTVWWEAGQGEPVSGSEKAAIERERKPHSDDVVPQPRRKAPAEPALSGAKVIRLSAERY